MGRIGAAVLLAFAIGCEKPETIREYTVENPPGPSPTHRMLAAIITDDGSDAAGQADQPPSKDSADTKDDAKPDIDFAWFFKLVGPEKEVATAGPAFDQFIRSIRIRMGDLPEWELPEGWVLEPPAAAGEFGRAATIRIGKGSPPLELTVSKLPMSKGRQESWMLGNVNRWRAQLALPPIARSELPRYTDDFKAGDQTGTKVDFVGAFSGPPMAGMLANRKRVQENTNSGRADRQASLPPGHPPIESSAPPTKAAAAPFDATVPSEWQPGRMNEFRVAAYNIPDANGGRAAEVLVTPLGPAAGDLRGNVDRWRNEIKLPPASAEELADGTKTIEVDGQKADYVDLVGPEGASPREATLGVILRRPDRVWFFKLRGQADVVAQQKAQFEGYVKSVKFH